MGKLVIFSAPSGSGKTTIVKEVLKEITNLEFSISACSRQPRKGEVHAKDYYFYSAEEFEQKINNNEFVEWEEVYTDNYYGTLKNEIERIWKNDKHVIFDVDVKGGLNIKKQYADKALAIFIKAPSVDELKKRLGKRNTETEEQINKRIDKAEFEMEFANKFDKVILNENLKDAVRETLAVVKEFLGN